MSLHALISKPKPHRFVQEDCSKGCLNSQAMMLTVLSVGQICWDQDADLKTSPHDNQFVLVGRCWYISEWTHWPNHFRSIYWLTQQPGPDDYSNQYYCPINWGTMKSSSGIALNLVGLRWLLGKHTSRRQIDLTLGMSYNILSWQALLVGVNEEPRLL